jgi:hypothetical protein
LVAAVQRRKDYKCWKWELIQKSLSNCKDYKCWKWELIQKSQCNCKDYKCWKWELIQKSLSNCKDYECWKWELIQKSQCNCKDYKCWKWELTQKSLRTHPRCVTQNSRALSTVRVCVCVRTRTRTGSIVSIPTPNNCCSHNNTGTFEPPYIKFASHFPSSLSSVQFLIIFLKLPVTIFKDHHHYAVRDLGLVAGSGLNITIQKYI